LIFYLKYALPLFLLVVKTNINYRVVATFSIQYEDSKSIEEALKVIKSLNITWFPQYFVTYYCEAEYNAITKIVEERTNKFFKLEYDIKVVTNNGVESQKKLLKSFY